MSNTEALNKECHWMTNIEAWRQNVSAQACTLTTLKFLIRLLNSNTRFIPFTLHLLPPCSKMRQKRINELEVIISPPDPYVVAGCIFWGLGCFSPSLTYSAYLEVGPTWSAAVSAHLKVPSSPSSCFFSEVTTPCWFISSLPFGWHLGLRQFWCFHPSTGSC